MALSTYNDLTTSIQTWLGRVGDTNVPTVDLIRLFEADANTRFFTHWQEKQFQFTTIAGTDTYALPVDFLKARELKITNLNPTRVIDYLGLTELDNAWDWNITSEPVNYTEIDGNIRFAPTPDATYTLLLDYFSLITPLSTTNINWLYQNFPQAYLYGALAEAEFFLGADVSDARIQEFTQKRDEAYSKIRTLDFKYRHGSVPLQMKCDLIWTP